MKSIFPFRLYAGGQCDSSPLLAREIWQRIRKKLAPNLAWYATDVVILSSESVKIFVYDIHDSVYGGIGKLIFETTVNQFTSSEQELLDKSILEACTRAADAALRQKELEERELRVIRLRQEMFGI